MSPIKSSADDKVKKSINATNYKRALNALEQSNFDKFVPLKTNKEILRLSLGNNINSTAFFELVTALFQSMTTQGFTTYEIVSFIANEINKFKGEEKKKILDFFDKSFNIVHSDYQDKLSKKQYANVKKILFNHVKEPFMFGSYTTNGAKLIGMSPSINRDIKTLCITKKDKLFQDLENTAQGNIKQEAIFGSFKNYFDLININKDIKNPTKRNPSFSSIIINNPDIRVGSRNALELATFFNSVSNIEFDRAYPFFNAEFVIPNYSKQDTNAVMHAASINQFIHGSLKKNKTTSNYKSFEGNKVARKDQNDGNIIKTNMALFTTPQTLVNLDEQTGHSSNKLRSTRSLRLTSIKDSTQPFMTLKNLSINVTPTKGFMSFKTGKLSLTLHDRSRLVDIAPFVKHDLFGSFGAEIILEYGWSHLDENNPNLNPVGAFLGNSKVKEVYMITNSSFSMDQNGMINIDLSISMKGASLLKNTEIRFIAENRVKTQALKSHIATIEACRQNLNLSSSDAGFLKRLDNDNLLNPTSRIDEAAALEISRFISEYSFLDDISQRQFVARKTDDINTNKFTIAIIDGNDLKDNKKEFLGLIFGKVIERLDNKDETTISCNYSKEEVELIIDQIIESYKELRNLSQSILIQDLEEDEIERGMIESIVGGIDLIDPFYPTDEKLYKTISQPASYVTFGSVLNSLLQTHILNKSVPDFDEIQTIFYTANQFAAGMRQRNLSSFLIPKKGLKDFIKKEIKKEINENNEKVGKGVTVLTVESLISQIINKFIVTKNNPMFGISDLYKLDQNQNIVSIHESEKEQQKAINKKLHEIYYPGTKPIDPKNDITFNVPSIRMTFDCLNSDSTNSKEAKTILRISIYDQNDTPFDTISNILQKLYTKDYRKNIDSIARIKSKYDTPATTKIYRERINKEFEQLEKKGFIKKVNGKYIFDPLKKVEENKTKSTIKSFYKELFPSLTFGTQHTSILSANVSTVNDNKLTTVYISRSDRNNQSEINSRIKPDLPLRVLPTQATLEIFGCPWINFGQFIFLDFDTGTTIDNKYAVTGITHNFSPGNFKTSLTLSYGDVYGQYEADANLIDSVLPSLNSKKPKLESQTTNSINDDQNYSSTQIIINGYNYRKNSFYEPGLFLNSNTIKPKTIKIANPICEGIKHKVSTGLTRGFFTKVSDLIIFNNTYTIEQLSDKDFIHSYIINNGHYRFEFKGAFIDVFKKSFKDNQEIEYDVYLLNNNPLLKVKNKNLLFSVQSELKSKKATKVIFAKKSKDQLDVVIENPKSFVKKNAKGRNSIDQIDFNKTLFNSVNNFKTSVTNTLKKEYPLNIEPFNVGFSGYYDILKSIQSEIKKNEGILNLRVRSFTLEDFKDLNIDKAFLEDWQVLVLPSYDIGGNNQKLKTFLQRTSDIVKADVYINDNEISAAESKNLSLSSFASEKKDERIVALKTRKEAEKSRYLGFKLGELRRKLSAASESLRNFIFSHQSFPIFKSIKVFYSSNVSLEIRDSIEKDSEDIKRYYSIELDEAILKQLYAHTSIVDISIINNETQRARLQITVGVSELQKGETDYVEYNQSTSNRKHIIDPRFELVSIFDPNFFHTQRLLDESQLPLEIKKNELIADNDEVLPENVEVYSILVSKIEERLSRDTSRFLIKANKHNQIDHFGPNSKYIRRLYTHTKEKKLGSELYKGKVNYTELPEQQQKFKFSPEQVTFDDSEWTILSTLNNTANSNEQSRLAQQQSNSLDNVNSILPEINKKQVNLQIMEEWIPPSSTSSSGRAGNVDFVSNANLDYPQIDLQLAMNKEKLAKLRAELESKYTGVDAITQRHVDFSKVKSNYLKNKEYLDYKLSDLLISSATPDSETIAGLRAVRIEYSSSIIGQLNKQIKKLPQRRTKIQPALYQIIYNAIRFMFFTTNIDRPFDKVELYSGGDIPLYKKNKRSLSTTLRHESGYAVDFCLKKDGRKLKLTNSATTTPLTPNQQKDNRVIWTFLRICKELGVTGVGADYDYENGVGFHIDIASKNPDFKNGKYNQSFKITSTSKLARKRKEKGLSTSFVFSEKQIKRSIYNINNARYWGKDARGSYKKEGAPPELSDIFKDKS